jgi:integrase
MRTPKYRRHSTRDCAFVEYRGRRHYFPGRWKSPESWDAYLVFLKDHCGTPKPAPLLVKPGTRLTVTELVHVYLDHAKAYYPAGPRSEYANVKHALRHLGTACGKLGANTVGPLKVKAIQTSLVSKGHSRTYINQQIARIKRCFKWAASEELIPIEVYQGVATVAGLKAGRTVAPEPPRRGPVMWDHFQPVLSAVSPTVAAMLRFQWFTGTRSDSVCHATPDQFDRTEAMWLWRPKHKTAWLGRELVVPIGPRARAAIEPLMREPGEYLFRPRDQRKNRKYRKRYDAGSYRQAVQRGIQRVNEFRQQWCSEPDLLPLWSPHALRHAKGHLIREKYGVEAAQAILGHDSLDATQIYSERRLELAKTIAAETG